MIVRNRLCRRAAVAAALALLLGAAAVPPGPALAHEAKCPVCKLDVVQDTATLDNEVALKFGRKRIEYRCVWCALRDAKTYRGDVTILAPSEIKGKPVLLSRKGEEWSVLPESAVFVGHPVSHRQCELGYRALTSREAFDQWIQANASLLEGAQPLTLPQLLELAK